MSKKIQVGFLLSYDYENLKKAIPPVYREADAIFIAEDMEYRTWSGEKFEVDQSFYDWIKQFDTEGKIQIYRDDFYIPELSAIENDTRERTMLSEKMGVGNWLIQVDADEYFIDFKKFVKTLRTYDSFLNNPEKTPVQIAGFLINMYKYTDDGLLYVDNPTKVLLATNYPKYTYARQNRKRIIYTDNLLMHECISRSEKELMTKLTNWGHSKDFDIEKYVEKWRSVNKENYKKKQDFFYLQPDGWKTLDYIDTKDLNEIKQQLNKNPKLHPSAIFLFKKNFGQYFKHLFK
ncbi:hypothetical protein [Aequorivita sp. Q41]|uniref:hypothetical protein n=1 Tax=Aequorivita sp. Q41 TaxID=3153300 RepID=UPI003241EE30